MKLTELSAKPSPADLYAREHETYNEDNVKQAIKAGMTPVKIMSRFQVSREFVKKCRNELRREGWKI